MATLYRFPISAPEPFRTIGIHYIARRIGKADAAVKTIVAHVRLMIEHRGFPPPLGFRKIGDELVDGPQAVTIKSLWRLDAVDAFFQGDGPDGATPAIAAGLQAADFARHGSALDRNAAGLVA